MCVGRQSQRDVGQRWRCVKGKGTWCPISSQRLMQRTQLLPNEKTRDRHKSHRTNNKTYISGCTLQTPQLWGKKPFYLRKESQTRRFDMAWSLESVLLWKALLSFIFDGESSMNCLYLGMEEHQLDKDNSFSCLVQEIGYAVIRIIKMGFALSHFLMSNEWKTTQKRAKREIQRNSECW